MVRELSLTHLTPGAWHPSAVLKAVAEPDRTAFQFLTGFQSHRADRGWHAGMFIAGVEDARRALDAVDGPTDQKADLVDGPRSPLRERPPLDPPQIRCRAIRLPGIHRIRWGKPCR